MEPRNKREAQLLELTQRRPGGWYAGRAGRRRAVVLGAALLALLWANAAVSWKLAPSDAAMYTCFAILAVVVAAGVVLWRALTIGTRGTVGLPQHLLDERQREDRLWAHAAAHRLTLLLLFAVYLGTFMAGSDDVIEKVPSAAVVLAGLALLATVAMLPTLAVAWRLTDPPEDDEDE
ncbi:hypothetical protein [Spirillospora sp. NPDC029432]|uniref:hypothetical protein n=1 Tax=Spirillospora sp. NPDC029432 TaxID=3154599 RepID=UPI0034553F08